ncbi:MAG: lytic transglycosylase domain-containing protein [Deltaproteobacteria bacterium]|nr:lytic transglycosylase domain-containing protein [Deltaproteobacteria bacterium]
MGMVKVKGILFIIVVLVSAVVFQANEARSDFYYYTDSNGVAHFTNVPTSAKFRWFMPETNSSRPTGRVYASYEEIIRNASKSYGVRAEFVKAIIKAESDFNHRARSGKGAIGIMQLMPETARLWGVRDIYDPAENIEGGVRYLKYLLDTFDHDMPLAAAAYNAGEAAVLKYRDIPPFEETRLFVERVLSYHKRYIKAGR